MECCNVIILCSYTFWMFRMLRTSLTWGSGDALLPPSVDVPQFTYSATQVEGRISPPILKKPKTKVDVLSFTHIQCKQYLLSATEATHQIQGRFVSAVTQKLKATVLSTELLSHWLCCINGSLNIKAILFVFDVCPAHPVMIINRCLNRGGLRGAVGTLHST